MFFPTLFVLATSAALAAPLTGTQSALTKRATLPNYCSTDANAQVNIDLVIGLNTCIRVKDANGESERLCGTSREAALITCDHAANNNIEIVMERYTPTPGWRENPPVSKAVCTFSGMPNDQSLSPSFWTTYNGDESLPAGQAMNLDDGITFSCEEPTKL